MAGMMNRGQESTSRVSFSGESEPGRGGGDVRGLSAREARGWPEDKAAGESVCTSPGPDPAGATGWECQERL